MLYFSCSESYHRLLVQGQGVSDGIWYHLSVLQARQCTQLSPHSQLRSGLWTHMGTLGRSDMIKFYWTFLSQEELFLWVTHNILWLILMLHIPYTYKDSSTTINNLEYISVTIWNTDDWLLFISGAILCLLGFVSAILVSFLDRIGVKQLGMDSSMQHESRKLVSHCSSLSIVLPALLPDCN